MSPTLRAVLLSLILAARVYAGDPAPAAEQPAAVQPVTVQPDADTAEEPAVVEWRDPFWPVGYKLKPVKPVATVKTTGPDQGPGQTISVNAPDWKGAFKKLQIKGTSVFFDRELRKRKYQALIGNRFMVDGDKIDVVHENQIYTFEVDHVTDKNVEMNKIKVRPQ